ncbi:hypothetical protein ENSA5_51670 [Enhygromyxa salina]|uniref:Uncharacterized protein n=1 Tax=Enhygromyxa salina TaxID=215803 RepID=A0A2S9XGT2_9BACT|nr:hypothetical protein [Enhygromyxa salina]PRP92073.1 hypothetical protein ENSA5_51670 [Enhygromyxa salina]
MNFVVINDKLAPIRILRQVEAVSDAEFAEFLANERAFKLREVARGGRWVEVVDYGRCPGLTPVQQRMCAEWLATSLPMIASATIGVAVTVPPEFLAQGERFTDQFDRVGIPSRICSTLDGALRWALERCYDEDVSIAPDLVFGGVDAFRTVFA